MARQRNPGLRSPRALRDERLIKDIQRVWQANLRVYGVRKVWRQLQREGIEVARCTVERLMRAEGLAGTRRGRAVRTTRGDPVMPCPLDRVKRQFVAERPNQLWVSDFTYVSTWQGFVYGKRRPNPVLTPQTLSLSRRSFTADKSKCPGSKSSPHHARIS